MKYCVLVCGGRSYLDRDRVFRVLDRLHAKTPISRLIAGDARGADALALAWADSRDVRRTRYKAHWRTRGNAAGPLRNARMLRKGQPHLVVAFPGRNGTLDMVNRARFAGVPVVEL